MCVCMYVCVCVCAELEDQLKRTDLQAQQSLRSPARPPGPAAALTPEAFGSR